MGKYRTVRSGAACHPSLCYYAQSQINRKKAFTERHATEWSLTSSLCGERGPASPSRTQDPVGRLPAWQCSGNVLFVPRKLTRANVASEAWVDWPRRLVKQHSTFNQSQRFAVHAWDFFFFLPTTIIQILSQPVKKNIILVSRCKIH